jgi:RecA-family ATPase
MTVPEGLILYNKIKTMDDCGIDCLDRIIDEHPGVRLVIIDTFVLFRSEKQKPGNRLYDLDYKEVAAVKAIADRYSVSILLIHHQRKMESGDFIDTFSGTHGITGAADTLLALVQDPQSRNAFKLLVKGRDVEQGEYALNFDKVNLSWSLIGEGSVIRPNQMQQQLMNTLMRSSSYEKPLSPKELAKLTGLSDSYIRNTLPKLVSAGLVKKADRGKYYYNKDL